MPRIQTFQRSSQLRTGTPARLRGADTQVATALAGLGGEIARQGQIAQEEQRVALQNQKNADDSSFVTEGTNRFLRQETERQADIETRGAPVDLKTLQADYTERANELAESAPSVEAKNELLAQADNAFTRKFFPGYTRHQSNLNVQKRVSATNNGLDDIQSEVLTGRTGVPEAVARTEAALAGLAETAGGVVDIDEARRKAMSGIGTSAIKAQINAGEGLQVVEDITEGKWDQFTTTAELESLQRQAFKSVQDEENRQQAEISKVNALAASNLEINVFRNNASYQDIDNAMETGVISPAKRTQLFKRLDDNAKAADKTADNLIRVQTSMSLGVPLDPTSKEDKAGVEQLWQSMLPEISGGDSDQFADSATSFIQSTGIIPKSLIGNISAFSRSGNLEQAAQAADIVSRLQDVDSPALNDLPKEAYGFGLAVSNMVRGGIDKQRAVELARNNTFGQSEQDKAATRIVLKDASADNVTFLNDKMDEFDPGLFQFQPEVTPVLQAEFQVLLNNVIPSTGGDIDAARQIAWNGLRNVWGSTAVNGGNQMMKYAPEAIYGSPDGNNDWISDQFTQDMADGGYDTDRVRLATDVITARQDKPSYPIFIADDEGVMTPALDENNLPIRWKPEFKGSPAYKGLEAEQNKAIKNAKLSRKIVDTKERWKRERFDKAAKAALEWERAMK